MSLAILDVPFKDTAAEQLRVAIDGQVPDTLCETVISHPDGRTPPLTLGVLGASHVVFVGKRENPHFTEEISCAAAHGVPLSRAGVTVNSRVEHLSPEAFAQRANALRREFGAGHPHSVVAEFPGSPDALTVLSAEPIEQGYRWVTWHGYPPGQFVWTSNTWTAVADNQRVAPDSVEGGS
ncbi:DUF2617 family protein [uncultured Corynebacterium sp.]|uniref:DUF2617 family protein n=1 Tax=uncultured Corynebacterium sp. TaxID=159447 RepID=UPI0026182382|nr:DUF2617 family protein [uncultured Corynebacterium sp.]